MAPACVIGEETPVGREPWSLRDPDRFTARPTIRLAYSLIIEFFAAKVTRHGTPART
jgi:hypothetical protein